LYALATEIYGIPQCYETLKRSIEHYRACLQYNVLDKNDAAFNLAQALQTLGEYISESYASTSAIHASYSQPEIAWAEARTILEDVKRAQMTALERSSVSQPVDSPAEQPDMESDDNADATGVQQDAPAIEEQVMTPSTVIETILAAIQADLSIAEVTGQMPQDDIAQLVASARLLDASGGYMAKDILATEQEIVRIQTRLDLESGKTPALQPLLDIIESQRQYLQTQTRPDPAALSDLADTFALAGEVRGGQPEPDVTQSWQDLNESQQIYHEAREILENTMKRPASTPAHHVPALIAANYVSVAKTFAIFALWTVMTSSATGYLESAKMWVTHALNSTNGFVKATETGPGLYKFTRTLKSVQRVDYRTIVATRDAVLATVRIFFLDRIIRATIGLMERPAKTSKQLEDQLKAIQALLKAAWPDATEMKQAIQSYLEDVKTDEIARELQKKIGVSETEPWSHWLELDLAAGE
jgi:hypothetical protein